MADCLTDDTLAQLMDRRLDPEALSALHEHVAACPDCRDLLNDVAGARPALGAVASAASGAGVELSFDPRDPPPLMEEFRLLRRLGAGAMGMVWLAHDTVLQRPVAVKFIADRLADEAALRRFRTEALAVARLSHPNIVSIYRVGQVQGRPFLVSEYVEGQNLERLELPLPWSQALDMGLQVARGLAAAHGRGILHRDIKPANLVLSKEGVVKILDFGLAKLSTPGSGEGALGQTANDAPVGTPRYMAPEAWEGSGQITERADVYAVGVLLYELCSGKTPWQARTLLEQARAVQWEAPALSKVAPAAPQALAEVVERCLRRDPAQRYGSGAELVRALEEAAGERVVAPRRWRAPSWKVRAGAAAVLIGGVGAMALKRDGVPAMQRVTERRTKQSEEMVLIPGGTFGMGSTPMELRAALSWCKVHPPDPCKLEPFQRELPLRQVHVSSFNLDTTEVTFAAFVAWLNSRQDLKIEPDRDDRVDRWVRLGTVTLYDLYPSFENTQGIELHGGRFEVIPGFARRPVTHVTWDGARTFCLDHGKRLPTEAEWEFAARGSQRRRFPWGQEEPQCDGVVVARARGFSCDKKLLGAVDVATAPQDQTPEGIYDLAGNVGEWVQDRYEQSYRPCDGCVDPVVEDSVSALRVIRGGAWNLTAVDCRVAARRRKLHSKASVAVGFRCARSSTP